MLPQWLFSALTSTSAREITLVSATFNEISSLMIILTSYVCIFITVLGCLQLGCASKSYPPVPPHLTAVTVFDGITLFLYCVPNSRISWLMVRVASVFYRVIIPMLNPLIYSLRNKDVKESVKKVMNIKLFYDKM